MADFRITGAGQLEDLGKRFKAEGTSGRRLRSGLLKSLQVAGKPMKEAAKQAALDELPHKGGLNVVVAGSLFSVRTKLTGRDPSLRITARGKKIHDIASTDRGRLRHLVFGHGPWVNQQIKPLWFTNAMKLSAKPVRKEALKAMNDSAKRITR